MKDRDELLKGLTDSEVIASRIKYGQNILENKTRRKSLEIFFDIIKEPMMILLMAACSIYFILGDITEGIIMLFAIFAVAGISIIQEVRSENAISELKKLSEPLTNVIRNNVVVSIPSHELVVNDIMIIEEGQKISADGEIVLSNDLTIDESILTGESFPVSKDQENNKTFSGTNVTAGWGYVEIKSTGMNTEIGKLGKSLELIKKERTPLQLQIDRFVKLMAVAGVIAFMIVWILNYMDSGNVLHSLMHGLTLAMAILPEEIPVALSTFMALGAYHLIKNNIITKQPQTVEVLGSATVICVDKTGTITENKMEVSELYDFKEKKICDNFDHRFLSESSKEIIDYGMWASEPVPFDPMEKALRKLFDNSGNQIQTSEYEIVKEYPLSGKPPMMTHIHSNSKETIIACKGAPEGILRICELDKNQVEELNELVRSMASKGLRVLGVAKAEHATLPYPEDQTDFDWKFMGLIGLSDPPKNNISEVIKSFHESGIEVKMITGDYPVTAVSIAAKVGIRNPETFLTGEQIIGMSHDDLLKTVKEVNIFARMLPEAKLLIVNALKEKGEIVAMTGDGVNDGPALKASHIGIAMGERGTAIAKQAASLVIVNDDLSNMVTAVSFGRKIYSNLKKAIQYIISIHIPLISIVTLPLILGFKYQNIFSPIHVIFLELVMGPTCSIVYENEPIEKDIMKQKPRKLTANFFNLKELTLSIVQGLVITAGLLYILNYAIESSLNENISRTLVFTTIVCSNIFLTLTGRSKVFTIFTTIQYKNKLLYVVILVTFLILFSSLTFSPLMNVFQFEPITVIQFMYCLTVAFISVIWVEVYKFFFGNKFY
ncbi:MAG: cation-translocating P-type ATPase [Ignavibacteria bacterium]|nr:cation-translocating P-type ATPase [Ignavibacteria bacterium]